MTGGDVALAIIGAVLVLAAGGIVVLVPRRDVLAVRHRAERPRTVLPARLTPSHRELPGRPSAASTARPLYVITDARERKE